MVDAVWRWIGGELMVNMVLSMLPKDNTGRITAAQIGNRLNIHGSEVRDIINQLRCAGTPVCSDRRGYYLSNDPKDILGQISSMEHRMNAMYDAMNGLKLALGGDAA